MGAGPLPSKSSRAYVPAAISIPRLRVCLWRAESRRRGREGEGYVMPLGAGDGGRGDQYARARSVCCVKTLRRTPFTRFSCTNIMIVVRINHMYVSPPRVCVFYTKHLSTRKTKEKKEKPSTK